VVVNKAIDHASAYGLGLHPTVATKRRRDRRTGPQEEFLLTWMKRKIIAKARLRYDGIMLVDSCNKLLRIESIIAIKVTANTAPMLRPRITHFTAVLISIYGIRRWDLSIRRAKQVSVQIMGPKLGREWRYALS
jgi:hypothetical protein